MSVEKNVAEGTTVFTSDGVEGRVLRSYEGTSVVVVSFPSQVLAMSRHELHYKPPGMASGVGEAWSHLTWGT